MILSERAEALLDAFTLMKVKIRFQNQSLTLRSSCFELSSDILKEFEYCEPELLRAYANDSSSTECLIPIVGGVGPRIYAVHSAVGAVYGYRHMAKLLSPRLAVWGFARAGGDMPTSVSDAVGTYVNELLAHSSGMPFVLYGGSAGGLLAIEMARVLEAMNRPPVLLVMADSFDPMHTLLASDAGLTKTGWISFFDWHCSRGWLPLLGPASTFWSLAELNRLEWLSAHRSQELPAAWNGLEELTSIYEQFRQFWIDVKGLDIKPIKSPSLYFHATHSPLGYSETIRTTMGSTCEIVDINNNHLELFRPSMAPTIAQSLSRRIAELAV